MGNTPGLLVAEASGQLLADDPAKNTNASTEHDLGQAGAVTQYEEGDGLQGAAAMEPAADLDGFAHVLR